MKDEVVKTEESIIDKIYNYLHSEGPGGMRVISAFMDEFTKLSERSPKDDPTNLKNHMKFLLKHIKDTWDESLTVTEGGEINVGVCTDETLGFVEDRKKLKHKPSPVVWAVYLIRGIGGRYAFVNPTTFRRKKGYSMPSKYAGGFLISKRSWQREGWDKKVGPFEAYEHPASGASPVPFFKNVRERADFQRLISEAIGEAENETN